MKPTIAFFGSDQYSQIVLNVLQKDNQWQITPFWGKSGLKKIDFSQQPDTAVIASGPILPKKILDWPKKGILNIHPSLLPKYRGPSPGQFAILNNDKQTGVTIIKLVEKVDQGPIVSQFTEPIRPNDTAASLYQRLFEKGAVVLKNTLPAYLADKIELREQDHSQATYTKRFTRDSGKIAWNQPNEQIARQIRALYPWPGTWTEINLNSSNPKKRLKILKAHLENDQLILDQVQLEGKKSVTWKQFQEGYPEAKIISF